MRRAGATQGENLAKIAQPSQIQFSYLKSNHFRVVHVDGAVGGLTPTGLIHAVVYSERGAIPREMVHEIGPDGKLGDVIHTEGRDGIVREMEVDMMLSEKVARELRDWLTERLRELETHKAKVRAH